MAKKKNRTLHPDEPLLHADHSRPVTRREFISQGFVAGSGAVLGPSMLSMFVGTKQAHALSQDLTDLKDPAICNIVAGAGKIPFICFDLAGGANFAGSNVLVGGQDGIQDSLTSAGYSKLGIPGDKLPDFATNANVNTDLGIPFHADSSLLAGIQMRFTNTNNVNGAVIPARSDNDTSNNPHNPMYGINKAGARGELLTLIGSRNSISGGNSMAPASMIDLSVLPTKIDRPNDTDGLVDTGQLAADMGLDNATRVMESIQRISKNKMDKMQTNPLNSPDLDDAEIKKQVDCAYVKSADIVERFGTPGALSSYPYDAATQPNGDPDMVGIFTTAEIADSGGDREFRKTAAVMKMVLSGNAGAGTITMGGYDYHTGNRTTGDARDLRAGQCIGACLAYAEALGKPLMIYVCSDGSVASNGTPDDAAGGKLVWTGDNSSTACSFFLVFKPGAGRPVLFASGSDGLTAAQHQQLGWFRPDASVETSATPAANNVNLLVETVVLNYMALHGEQGQFTAKFPNHGLGDTAKLDRMTAFEAII